MKKTSVEEDRARAKRMEIWYKEDCRDNPKHPYHGLYTGLYELAKEGKLTAVALGE